jgi:Chlorophyll A-B binding protein
MRSGRIIEEQGRVNIFAVEPKMYVTEESQAGWTVYAEKLNGRLAMIGFVSLLLLEVATGHGLLGFFSALGDI